ncbi:MAG: hypothetical protein KDC95_07310 [Planctomycetes bacterium]|nr:hypothetical protein [Planctomycetota bacterium]
MVNRSTLFALTSVLLAASAADALACFSRDTVATPNVIVRSINGTTWRVLVPGYTSVAAASGSYCAIGVSIPTSGSIVSVDDARVIGVDASTYDNVTWSSSTAVATAFNTVSAGNWTGFLGQATNSIAAGTKVVYDIVVTVSSGTTLAQLTTDLLASDIGSDAATSTGSLAGGTLQSVFRPTTVTEQVLYRNSRVFHNEAYSNISTRATADSADTLVFMQPRDFRRGQGEASGWVVRVQDQDQSTSEDVALGFVAYSSTTADTPDLTPAGRLTTVRYTLFGTGSGAAAAIYTLTTSVGVPVGEFSGLTIELPKPATDFPADGLTVAMQDGDTTFLPAAARAQWTYVANGATATALRPAGTTMHFGGLYDCGTIQSQAFSSVYGSNDRLSGAEALSPDATGGDLTSFRIQNQKFASSVALIMVAADYGPIKSSATLKDYLLQPLFTTLIVPTDANGVGNSIGFPVPPSVLLAVQGCYFNFTNLTFQFGDACRFQTR